MIVDRYDPMNLFEELVPKLKLEMEPELRELDRLLNHDELFSGVKADLSKRYPNSERLGRHSTPVEVILRMLVVKRHYITRSSCAQPRRVASTLRERTDARARCLVDGFERFVPLVEQGIDQAVRREYPKKNKCRPKRRS